MAIRIGKKFLGSMVALIGLLTLASCDVPAGTKSLATPANSVVVAGPPGFCIDPEASHSTNHGSFVLLGACDALNGPALGGPKPVIRAVLAAAVTSGGSGASIAHNQQKLSRFFRSAAGRKLLSRSGNARTVRVLGDRVLDDAYILHARDTSAFPGHAVSPDYWRALFDLNGHIVTLSVIGVPQARFTDKAALATLRGFISATRAATPKAQAAN